MRGLMRTFAKFVAILSIMIASSMIASSLHAATVLHPPQNDLPLAQKWAWAQKEARDKGFAKGYWIGYYISE